MCKKNLQQQTKKSVKGMNKSLHFGSEEGEQFITKNYCHGSS